MYMYIKNIIAYYDNNAVHHSNNDAHKQKLFLFMMTIMKVIMLYIYIYIIKSMLYNVYSCCRTTCPPPAGAVVRVAVE